MLQFFEKTPGRLAAWMKQHLLVSTVFAIFLVYFLYEVVTSYVVVCRDAYVTADIVVIAPEVSGPMLERAVSNDHQRNSRSLREAQIVGGPKHDHLLGKYQEVFKNAE